MSQQGTRTPPESETGGLLDVDSVSVEFSVPDGTVKALRDVSVTVEKGETLGIAGESGSGKSTLALAIVRYLASNGRITEGSIEFKGRDVYSLSRSELQGIRGNQIAHVAQNPASALNPSMVIGEQIKETIDLHQDHETDDAAWEQVYDVLRQVNIPQPEAMADRYPSELSGGQQQRVALARALITEPTVLLLDEPLGALDLKLRKNMQIELKNLQEELGTTFIYVTHDQEEALTMSDKIAVMNDGKIEQIGTANEIYEAPKTEFVADFIGESNLVHGAYGETDAGAFITAGGIDFQVPRTETVTGDASFAIRPEKIRIDSTKEQFDNVFQASVVERIYKGNVGKFVVELENGQHLTIDHQINNQDQYESFEETAFVGWNKENTVVLTE